MEIHLEEKGNKGRAYVGATVGSDAQMTYSKAAGRLYIIDHTEVSEKLRGQSVGRKLLDALVELARSKQFKILPLCPYAKSVFDKDQSIHDVLSR